MTTILESLIFASERAANVARACCESSEQLLIAEKCEGEANARFDKDFKTIADVLAQECAKFEISSSFPGFSQHVRGEECAEINGVSIALKENEDETSELLSALVPQNTARRMAEAAHSKPELVLNDMPKELHINTDDLGVWIDPIDATSEFIAGVHGENGSDKGLVCVTVLIGAYKRSTGEPVLGVINQPFYDNGKGRIIWGVCYDSIKKYGGINLDVREESQLVLMSSAEDVDIRKRLEQEGYQIKSIPGAGHKLMKVALGEASLYILSRDTTFRWDTCAPHAILRSRGGDLIKYNIKEPVTYNDPYSLDTQMYCNKDGIIAYCKQDDYKKYYNHHKSRHRSKPVAVTISHTILVAKTVASRHHSHHIIISLFTLSMGVLSIGLQPLKEKETLKSNPEKGRLCIKPPPVRPLRHIWSQGYRCAACLVGNVEGMAAEEPFIGQRRLPHLA